MSDTKARVLEWLESAPQEAKEALASLTMYQHLRKQRNTTFQMIGKYDGSMDETIKAKFKGEYEALDAMMQFSRDEYSAAYVDI